MTNRECLSVAFDAIAAAGGGIAMIGDGLDRHIEYDALPENLRAMAVKLRGDIQILAIAAMELRAHVNAHYIATEGPTTQD